VSTIITTLVASDNEGRSTECERAIFLATLRAARVRVRVTDDCFGIWFDDDGIEYAEPCVHIVATGSTAAIRNAIAAYGETTGQLAVLCVEADSHSHIVGCSIGRAGAQDLAKVHGGATLFPDGDAVSYEYQALTAGVDYAV
jgi:hypothetical protein